jgi:hypothetical protein
MRNYVQIEGGKVAATLQTGGKIDQQNMIEVDSDPAQYIGMVYENGEFIPGPAPAPVVVITRLDFITRFTDAELEAIYTAAKQSVAIEIYLDKIKAADDVTVTDPRTVAGVESLAAAGLIDAGRVSEILAAVVA